jgi:hypothetical protein
MARAIMLVLPNFKFGATLGQSLPRFSGQRRIAKSRGWEPATLEFVPLVTDRSLADKLHKAKP